MFCLLRVGFGLAMVGLGLVLVLILQPWLAWNLLHRPGCHWNFKWDYRHVPSSSTEVLISFSAFILSKNQMVHMLRVMSRCSNSNRIPVTDVFLGPNPVTLWDIHSFVSAWNWPLYWDQTTLLQLSNDWNGHW